MKKRTIKKISIFVIAECFKAIFRLLMFALVVYAAGRIIAFQTRKKPLEKGTYVQLKLADKIPESKLLTPFDIRKETNFYGFLEAIKKIENDERVQGLILNFDDIKINNAQIEELIDKLEEFKKSNKKIYAYAPSFTNNNYMVASVADRVIMPNTMSAVSNLKGYFIDIPYLKAVGDRFGVKMNIIHIGRYKSAGENYVRNKMSDEFRENTKQLLDTKYDNFVSVVAKNRNIDEKVLDKKILSGDLVLVDPRTMMDNKLIDEMIYYDQFLEKQGIDKEKVIGMAEYLSRLQADKKKEETEEEKQQPKIAIVYAEGTIKYSNNEKDFEKSITPDLIIKRLKIAEKDESIKGIVLRINSPGGSALASDIIYNTVKNLSKPVYISMGGVAASGGYYMATAGDKIYADNGTITGSIGVVTMIPNISGLIDKSDVNYSYISKGKYNNIGSLIYEMTDEEKEKIIISSEKVYNEFVEKVSLGRKLKKEDVLKIAEGRVWLGKDAVKIGLVDEIGGIEKTISDLAKHLNLKEYKTIESLKEEKIESVIKNYLPKYLMAKVIGDNKILESVKSINVIDDELLFKPILYAPNIIRK